MTTPNQSFENLLTELAIVAQDMDMSDEDRVTCQLAVNTMEDQRREIEYWKANHAREVQRAKFIKNRVDLPLERLRLYDQLGYWHDLIEDVYKDPGLSPGLRERVDVGRNTAFFPDSRITHEALRARVDSLVQLVKKLVVVVRKHAPSNQIADNAMLYLEYQRLHSTPVHATELEIQQALAELQAEDSDPPAVAPVAAPVEEGESPEDYTADQWWFVELTKAVRVPAGATVQVTFDLKRAVAVVRKLLALLPSLQRK